MKNKIHEILKQHDASNYELEIALMRLMSEHAKETVAVGKCDALRVAKQQKLKLYWQSLTCRDGKQKKRLQRRLKHYTKFIENIERELGI